MPGCLRRRLAYLAGQVSSTRVDVLGGPNRLTVAHTGDGTPVRAETVFRCFQAPRQTSLADPAKTVLAPCPTSFDHWHLLAGPTSFDHLITVSNDPELTYHANFQRSNISNIIGCIIKGCNHLSQANKLFIKSQTPGPTTW